MARIAAIIRRRKRLGGGGSVPVELVAPVLTHSDRIVDDLPDFSIALTDPVVGDVVTLRRSSTSNFASYEDATCAIASLSPLTTLTFDFGAEWAAQTWYTKTFFTRNGSQSPDSNTESFTLEADGLEVDFVNGIAVVRDTVTPANVFTGTPISLLSETVSANGTYINSSGVITQATSNVMRLDYNPSTLAFKGLLIEESRTNLLLNSLIDGTNITTQSVTVSATPYTLSFYGTGTLTLSGVSTAGPLVGTGAYPNRVSLTFTPTAGSLTITRSGTVQYAQLEAGSHVTSFIPTAGSSVTRAADSVTLATSSFNFSSSNVTMLVSAIWGGTGAAGLTRAVQIDSGSATSRFLTGLTSTAARCIVTTSGSPVADISVSGTTTSAIKVGLAAAANDYAVIVNGGSASVDSAGSMPGAVTTLRFGATDTGASGQVWIQRFVHLPRRMSNADIQGWTT